METGAAVSGLSAPRVAELARLRESCNLMLRSRENYDALAEMDASDLLMQSDDVLEEMVRKNAKAKSPMKIRDIVYHAFVGRMMKRDLVGAATIILPQHVFDAEPWAVQKIWTAMDEGSYVSILGAGGVGKCLGRGTAVLMADGTVKPIEEIQDGEFVMGDDSTPRRVMNTTAGRGILYRVTTKRGDSWVCNEHHVLSLKCAMNKKNGDGKSVSINYTKGRVIDQPIKEWLSSSKQHREFFKQYRVGWELPAREVEHDAYIYGLWLADGGWDTPMFHKPEGPQSRRWCEYFSALGYRIAVSYGDSGCPAWCARKPVGMLNNNFTRFIRSSVNELREKFIRPEYLINSRENRAKLLAGLLDGDGSALPGGGYEIITKHKHLAESIRYLGNSLGYRVSVVLCEKSIKSIGFTGQYWRCFINGQVDVPVLAKPPLHKNGHGDSSLAEIVVTKESDNGEYFGFECDGNHRFLLADGTVTHNSYCVAVRYFMELMHDADATRVDLVSKNDEKLKKLFADFVNLHRQACIKLPGAVEAETISTDKMGGWGIFRNLIRAGEESSSVLKGTHEKPRTKLHPVYGHRTARFVMIDEAQDVSPAVFDDVGNILLSIRGDDGANGTRRMRQITMTANPSLPNSRYGEQNKPEGGWASLDDDAEDWKAKLGARCVRIDALKTENVRLKKDLYQGMITAAGVEKQLAMCDGNENHPLWWTYVRGFFPPEGAMSTLIPMRWLTAAAGEWIFDNSTVEHCGKDVARLGADSPAMAFGRVGRAVAWRDETGHEYRLAQSGYRVQIDSVFRIPQGDTQEVADDGMRRLRSTTVRPENCAVDMTGSSGVFDLMVHQWRGKGLAASAVNPQLGETPNWAKWVEPEQVREVVGGSPVIGVSYSRRPSELKVALEDSGTPRELYVNTATELWYALSKYFELGYIRYGKGVGREALEEISTRKGGLVQGKGRRMAVESKDSHKKRLSGASCDLADSITLLLHSIRLGTPELQPKARDTKESAANSQGGSRLRDGEAFSIKDESGFGADTLETVMAAHEGDDGRQQNVMESLGAGQSNPANWT